MEKNNIKVHPPWYARGTPVTNPRDGRGGNRRTAAICLPRNAVSQGQTPDNMWPWLTLKIFNTVNLVDADRACPDPSGSNDAVRSGERSEVAAVHFDLSACAAPDNVKMIMDNVKMVEEEERSEIVDADRACPDPSGSNDAVRSEERSEVAAVHFDLSACAVPDNVKMVMDNVKMLDDDTIDIYILKRTKIK